MLLFDQDRINDNSVCVDELSEEYAITEDAENDEIVGKVEDSDRVGINGNVFQKKKSTKIIVISFLLIIFLLLLYLVFFSIYKNTDAYKIKRATDMVRYSDPSTIVELIGNIDTPEAIVLINYSYVMEVKKEFEYMVSSESCLDALDEYDKFETAFREFEKNNSIEFLPEELKADYHCCKTAFDFVNEYTDESGEFSEVLYNAQVVMMNEVDLNNSAEGGGYVTLSDLQSRVDTSKFAVDLLSNYYLTGYFNPDVIVYDSDIELYCNTDVNQTGKGSITVVDVDCSVMERLLESCSFECEQSQELIDEMKLEYGMYDKLYRKYAQSSYGSDNYWMSEIDGDLEVVSDYGDISKNVNTVLDVLRVKMLYSLINGYAP